ncbi:unnamed protein product [marine sediment metagenome]|uniref:Uncharacterized protein n=1 Tax=marine sediment metagenome TaxID=412755 RepID=X1A853_9ZZZZ
MGSFGPGCTEIFTGETLAANLVSFGGAASTLPPGGFPPFSIWPVASSPTISFFIWATLGISFFFTVATFFFSTTLTGFFFFGTVTTRAGAGLGRTLTRDTSTYLGRGLRETPKLGNKRIREK